MVIVADAHNWYRTPIWFAAPYITIIEIQVTKASRFLSSVLISSTARAFSHEFAARSETELRNLIYCLTTFWFIVMDQLSITLNLTFLRQRWNKNEVMEFGAIAVICFECSKNALKCSAIRYPIRFQSGFHSNQLESIENSINIIIRLRWMFSATNEEFMDSNLTQLR